VDTRLPVPNPGPDRHLVILDADHPGFLDTAYRARRDEIARIAADYRGGERVPRAPYVEAEERVWRTIWDELEPRHRRCVCSRLNRLQDKLGLARGRLPQLADLNVELERATAFRMEPVGGLVAARDFFLALRRGVFLSTQYIRHASRPLYTPEPDVVHETVGHAASLMDHDVAELSRGFGRAAQFANEEQLERLNRAYWYSLEFSLVVEAGRPRAFGAGLLSSAGELDNSPVLRGWDLERIAITSYDSTCFQPALFVAPSSEVLVASVAGWLEGGGWRG
jgi:phenylalanine-4-hydroxylase